MEKQSNLVINNDDIKLTSIETAKSIKTLLVALQSMRTKRVRINLRNDTFVEGTLIRVDGCMNVELVDAVEFQDTFYITPAKNNTKEQMIDESKSDIKTKNDVDKKEDISKDGSDEYEDHDLDTIIIKGTKIRYIEVLEDVDIIDSTKKEISRIRSRYRPWTKKDIVKKQE